MNTNVVDRNVFFANSQRLVDLINARSYKCENTNYLTRTFGLKNQEITDENSLTTKYRIYWESRSLCSLKNKIITEYGASIEMGLSTTSTLYIRFFPAYTDLSRAVEDRIDVFESLPQYMFNYNFVQLLLVRLFCSYSLVTSIDATPTMGDKWRVYILRLLGNRVIMGIQQDSRFKKIFLSFLRFFITFVCSSLFVYYLQCHDESVVQKRNEKFMQKELFLLQSVNNEVREIKIEFKEIETVKDSLYNSLNEIKSTLKYGIYRRRTDSK